MKYKLSFVLASLGLVVLFQNCAKTSSSGASAVNSPATSNATNTNNEVVLGTTSDLNRISYNSSMNQTFSAKADLQNIKILDVSVDTGTYTLTEVQTQKKIQCPLSVTQEQILKSLLSVSRGCQPAALEAESETVRCMALPVGEDVVLSNEQRKVGLAKVVC